MDSERLASLKSKLGRLQGEIADVGKAIKLEEERHVWYCRSQLVHRLDLV